MASLVDGAYSTHICRSLSLRSPLTCSSKGNRHEQGKSSHHPWKFSILSANNKKYIIGGSLASGGLGWAIYQGWLGRLPNPCNWKSAQVCFSGKASDVTTDTDAKPPCANSSDASSKSDPENRTTSSELVLVSGATSIPHPQKVEKGGEDAFFIADNKLSIGVADGVGGWALSGVDAGQYARMLMSHAKEFADREVAHGPDTPKRMLSDAHKKTPLPGSSTACILSLDSHGAMLYGANLGDSGFVVFREDKIIYQTEPQQYKFNHPYQLGYDTTLANTPEQAQDTRLSVQPGDVIVAGTDGLWDNLFMEDCTKIVQSCRNEGMGPLQTSKVLGICAQMKSLDLNAITPFMLGARQNGLQYMGGGKPDDITIVVSFVSYASSKL